MFVCNKWHVWTMSDSLEWFVCNDLFATIEMVNMDNVFQVMYWKSCMWTTLSAIVSSVTPPRICVSFHLESFALYSKLYIASWYPRTWGINIVSYDMNTHALRSQVEDVRLGEPSSWVPPAGRSQLQEKNAPARNGRQQIPDWGKR